MDSFGESCGSPKSFNRLSPGIFNHPLWIYYQRAGMPGSQELLPGLLAQSEELYTNGDAGSACQVLFLCAAILKHLNEYAGALQLLEQIKRLANQNNWSEVVQWVAWGSAAVQFRQGQLDHAAEELMQLRTLLMQAGDWVLADLLEVLLAILAETDTRSIQKDSLVGLLLSWGDTLFPVDSSCLDSKKGASALQTGIKRISIWLSTFYRGMFHSLNGHKLFQSTNPGLIELVPNPRSDQIRLDSLAPISLEFSGNNGKKEPSLVVYCLGQFQAYQDEQPINDWPTYKSKLVFKYLVTHHERPIPKEVLMDIFWPDSPPDAARNNLNVAIHGIRKVLHQKHPHFSHILFQEGQYSFNPRMRIWVDAEEFSTQISYAKDLKTKSDPAIILREYQKAETLYQGDYLEEDRYEEWTIMPRESLRLAYLDCLSQLSYIYFKQEQYLAAAALCQRILIYDDCSEDAYRLLMRCYVRQGQPNLALRLYHSCLSTLKKELDILPSSETRALYEHIRRHEPV